MTKISKTGIAMFVSAIALAACGGGGGGDNNSSPSNPPVVTLPPVVVDTTAPMLATVPNITPTNGATDVATASTITFNMNEALAMAGVKVSCDSVGVPGATTVSGTLVTFKPTDGFPNNGNCVANIVGPETKDVAGNAMTNDVALTSFTVKSLMCPTGTTPNTPPAFNGTPTVAVCNTIFVDPAIARSQYATIVNSVNASVDTVKAFYNGMQASPPDVIICQSDECMDNFAGGRNRNVTVYPNGISGNFTAQRMTIILVKPYDINLTVLAHEMSHVETATRTFNKPVNTWFNEGLATYVGSQPSCATTMPKGIDDLNKLSDNLAWNNYTANAAVAENTYCQARVEVAAWINKNGKDAALDLINKLGQGQDFNTLYGPLLTQ